MDQSALIPPKPQEIWVVIRVNRNDVFYIRHNLEAYEGLALPTTLPGKEGLIRIVTEKRLKDDLAQVLEGMAKEIDLRIIEWGETF